MDTPDNATLEAMAQSAERWEASVDGPCWSHWISAKLSAVGSEREEGSKAYTLSGTYRGEAFTKEALAFG